MEQSEVNRRFIAIVDNEPIPQTPEERILLAAQSEELKDALTDKLFWSNVCDVAPTPENRRELSEKLDVMARLHPLIMSSFSLDNTQYDVLIEYLSTQIHAELNDQ